MENINDRIRMVLEKSEMTKTAFGEVLKVSQQYISKLIRTGNPSDRLIDDICEKILIHGKRIDETWLRTGKGKMFIELSASDEYCEAAKMISQENDIDAMNAVIEYWKLDPSSKKAVWNFIRNLSNRMSDSDNYNTSSSTPQTDITLDPRDAATLSAAVQEAENSYIKSRSISARKMESSASSTIDGESRKVINR